MFDAVLKKDNGLQSDAVSVEFPIRDDKYEQTIRVLNEIHIGAAQEKDCCIVDIDTEDCPAVRRLIDTMVNVDELNWLARKIESFDRYELLQFNAAAERFALSSVGEMIDLSLCSNGVTVISDFSDLELVGERHYLTVHGAIALEELSALDSAETARRLIADQPGHVTQYGVVYDNGVKLEQAYDRKHLPRIWWGKYCVMELEIGARGETDTKKFEWIQLPTSQIKLERAMLRAGSPSCGEMQILFSGSRFPDEVDCALDFEQESLFELNRLCQVCTYFDDIDFEKLGAVCQMAKPACAANIRQLAKKLDRFDLMPGIHTPEELGKYMIQRSGHHKYDESLADFYNYDDYGISRMLQEDGVIADSGYVSYHGTLTLEELMQEYPAESYQQEQETTMEGMAW